MGCGCGKSKSSVVSPPTANQAARQAIASGAVQMYDVFKADGSLVASYTSLPMARAESRRVGGNVVPRRNAETVSA